MPKVESFLEKNVMETKTMTTMQIAYPTLERILKWLIKKSAIPVNMLFMRNAKLVFFPSDMA